MLTLGGIGGTANTAVTVTARTNLVAAANATINSGASNSNTVGNGNTAMGSGAGAAATGDSNVYIGAGMNGVAGESNACYIASIFGQTSASGMPVLINSNNKLGTTTSSVRFKEDIKPMDNVSEALFALKPVTFRYKKEIDTAGISQLGLVAEEVADVEPLLVTHTDEGAIEGVKYDRVTVALVNAVKEQQLQIESQQKQLDEQKKVIESLKRILCLQDAHLDCATRN